MTKRTQLYLLLALFFGPLIIAWIWFFHFENVRPGTVNKGDLVEPVVPLADMRLHPRGGGEALAPFDGDWTIVVLAPDACDADCRRALHYTRQVWLRLNKDAYRVQRVLIAGRDVAYRRGEHPDLRVFDSEPGALARFAGSARPSLAGAERFYLVDPRGNVMLSYPLDFEPEMLSDDLKRLLRYSDAR